METGTGALAGGAAGDAVVATTRSRKPAISSFASVRYNAAPAASADTAQTTPARTTNCLDRSIGAQPISFVVSSAIRPV
jgi:hypothetical protein